MNNSIYAQLRNKPELFSLLSSTRKNLLSHLLTCGMIASHSTFIDNNYYTSCLK